MTEPARRRWNVEQATTRIVAWLLAALFASFGIAKLTAADAQVAMFQAWGYPLWFMAMVGAAEVTAAALLIPDRTRFYGAGLVFALMIGAAVTHGSAGEILQLPLPAVTAALAALLASLEMPAGLRRTSGTPARTGGRA